ncbi:hypothetical protein KL86SPO_50334 [uncultured Sporomusa sp.]|uniref:Uncharacterized protein n=1 Tax=uncultured Sporomusa sp. TaxID=307249 RepID=A0A212LYC1_9FIRM|nr:hypothetical protein KL86SPO_50334 [uncultured Sporomusa sp.]
MLRINKQEILFQINNYCASAQQSIAKNFENLHSEELLFELSVLSALLDEFLGKQAKM